MNFPLLLLAFRRALAPAVLASFALLALLLITRDWSGENAKLDALLAGADPELLSRGMSRAGVWAILALAFAPLLVVRAARTIPSWRAGEGEWLGSRAAGRGVVLVSTWLGTWLGGVALFLLACLTIEARLGTERASFERTGEIALPDAPWIEPGKPLIWSTPDPGDRSPPGTRARVEVGFAMGAGSATEVLFIARRARTGSPESVACARVAARGSAEVEVPAGPGDLILELACDRPGSRACMVSEVAELWAACPSDRAASLRILASLATALCAWSGLAIGLAAWVSAPTAALALLAAWLGAWLADATPAWFPGGDLWAAIAIAGSGRVPQIPDPTSLLAALGLAALGLCLGAAGLSHWRAS